MKFGVAGGREEDEFREVRLLRNLNLDALELEFVRGVYMKEDYAKELKKFAPDIIFSAHAPHYINLNANEKIKIENSKRRIIKSAKVLRHLGKNLVFHCGYYLKKGKKETFENIKNNLEEIINELNILNININLRPENTGKISQFGSLEEILELCSILNLLPCIDFHHLYARSLGKINSYEDFCSILLNIEEKLGSEALKDMHIHISGVEYGK